jgi:hypothetical protein
VKVALPKYIPRTGEIELRNCESVLSRHRGLEVVATEKIDGFSCSFGLANGKFILTARERVIDDEASVFAVAAKAMEFEARLRATSLDNIIFQGELAGPGIRENLLDLDSLQWFAFNTKPTDGGFFGWNETRKLAARAGLQTVPETARVKLFSYSALEKIASQKSSVNPAVAREGCVFRPAKEMRDGWIGRLSFKVFSV